MWIALLFSCSDPAPVAPPPKPVVQRKAQAANGNNPDTGEAEPGSGLWNRAREPVGLSEEIKQLEAIGYTGGDEVASGQVGVTVHTEAAVVGLNFWVSGHAPEAFLMDMDGAVLHSWKKPFSAAFPNGDTYKNQHGSEFWRRAHMYPNGDLLGIYEGHGLVKLDRDSKVLWTYDGRTHHDLQVLDDGRIWVLSRKGRMIPRVNPQKPVLEDFAVLLSPEGEVLREISLLDALDASGGKYILYNKQRRRGDIFHTNSLEVLDKRAEPYDPAFKEGNLLLSMRSLSAIMVLDPDKGEMVWWKQGEFKRQHDPKILDNGHLMLFDNLGYGGNSAVREYELKDFRQLWIYGHSSVHPFFSRFTGAAYRFDNGNTLIAESGYGRVFEINPQKQVVWEFHNPNRAGEKGQFVAIIPDMVRYPPGYATFLD